VRAADIEQLISVGRPDIASDGSFAVFATSRPDRAANRAVGQVWRVDLPGGIPRRLTRGTADSAPRLSPDASRFAFVRGDAKGRGQIHVVDAGGGEPVQVTDAPLGVESFDWSEEGTSLAFSARVPEERRLPALWEQLYPDPMPKLRYWVIFNNQLHAPPVVVRPRWFDIITRSSSSRL